MYNTEVYTKYVKACSCMHPHCKQLHHVHGLATGLCD
jgi:hypothetical protein